MSPQTKDFLRAWLWAIEHRPVESVAVLEWMWAKLLEYEEDRPC